MGWDVSEHQKQERSIVKIVKTSYFYNQNLFNFRKERRRTRLLNQLKKGAGAIKSSLPKIKDVNVIDKYSRFVFPVSFILFNIAYWCFYVLET